MKRGVDLRILLKGFPSPKRPTMDVFAWIQPPRYRAAAVAGPRGMCVCVILHLKLAAELSPSLTWFWFSCIKYAQVRGHGDSCQYFRKPVRPGSTHNAGFKFSERSRQAST